MAFIKSGLGTGAKGKSGDIYWRTINGKTVFSSCPAHYRVPTDQASQNKFNSARMIGKIGSVMVKDDLFRSAWGPGTAPKGLHPFNRFFSYNHPKLKKLVIPALQLTPGERGFPISINNTSVSGSTIMVTLNPIGTDSGVDAMREPLAALRGIMLIYEEGETEKNVPTIALVETEAVPTDLLSPMVFPCNYNITLIKTLNVLMLFSLFSLSSTKAPVNHSITLSCNAVFTPT
jgi:hypothetical protein